jgi:hypothetical protein
MFIHLQPEDNKWQKPHNDKINLIVSLIKRRRKSSQMAVCTNRSMFKPSRFKHNQCNLRKYVRSW